MDILNVLKRLYEEDETLTPPTPAEPDKTETRNFALLGAVSKDNLDSSPITQVGSSPESVSQLASSLAVLIEQYRTLSSDLMGAELIDALKQSIIRLNIYYWYAFDIYQSAYSSSTSKINVSVVSGKLLSPGEHELKRLLDLFESLPVESQTVITAKKDFITIQIEKAKLLRTELDKRNKEDLKKEIDQKKRIKEKEKLKKSNKPVHDEDEVEESLILTTINKHFLIEAGHAEDAHFLNNEPLEYYNEALEKELLKSLASTYANAQKADLPDIDNKIFKRFSNPLTIKYRLMDPINKAAREQTALLGAAGLSGESSDEYSQLNKLAVEPEVLAPPENVETSDLAGASLEKASPETKTAIQLAAPKIFSSDNFLLAYFANINFLAIVGELLERWSTNPATNITYYDITSNNIVTKSILEFFRTYTDSFVEGVSTSIPTLAVNILADSADQLTTISGEPAAVSDTNRANLISVFRNDISQGTPEAINFSKLTTNDAGILLRFLQQTTQDETIKNVSFQRRNKYLAAGSAKDKILQSLNQLLLSETDINRQKELQLAIEQINLLTSINEIEAIANRFISSSTVADIIRHSEDKPVVNKALKIASDYVSNVIYTYFRLPNAASSWIFKYNNKDYTDLRDIQQLIVQMTADELTAFRDAIYSGKFITNLPGNPAFLNMVGPAKRSITGFQKYIEQLIILKKEQITSNITEGILLEEISNADVLLALENAYLNYLVSQSIPILQKMLVTIKKLPIFLINLVVIFKKYAEYRKNESQQKEKLTFGEMTQEELNMVPVILKAIKGTNKDTSDTLKSLLEDLKYTLLSDSIVEKLTTLFEEQLNNSPSNVLFKPTKADFIMKNYASLKEWLLKFFSRSGDTLLTLGKIFKDVEVSGSFASLRTFLISNAEIIEAGLKGAHEHKTETLLRTIQGISRGVYQYYDANEEPKEIGTPVITPEVPEISKETPHEDFASGLSF